MHLVETWLHTLPPILVYLLVATVIGLESTGVPLPGELTLVTAALMSATGVINPLLVGLAASVGAIAGDSFGYYVGHRGGRPLLVRLGKRFPKHFGPHQLARADATFERWGVWAVFFGRFVALLRILAGPLAGALRVPYRRFLAANASGGLIWSFGTTFVVYFAGRAAERWLADFGWVALLAVLATGGVTMLVLKWRADRGLAYGDQPASDATATDQPASDDAATVDGSASDDAVTVDEPAAVPAGPDHPGW